MIRCKIEIVEEGIDKVAIKSKLFYILIVLGSWTGKKLARELAILACEINAETAFTTTQQNHLDRLNKCIHPKGK